VTQVFRDGDVVRVSVLATIHGGGDYVKLNAPLGSVWSVRRVLQCGGSVEVQSPSDATEESAEVRPSC
jgi:hypothetical protein